MMPSTRSLFLLALLSSSSTITSAWNLSRSTKTIAPTTTSTRSQFLQQAAAAALVLAPITPALANDVTDDKLLNLSNDDLREALRKDIVDRQFLATGRLTRALYDESATFTDEIDTYTLPKWMEGTQKLFVGKECRVALVGDIEVTNKEAVFRFDEDLVFNIPLVKPKVALTGKLVLKRSPETGLITSYQEFWDQDVNTVLASAKLFGK